MVHAIKSYDTNRVSPIVYHFPHHSLVATYTDTLQNTRPGIAFQVDALS